VLDKDSDVSPLRPELSEIRTVFPGTSEAVGKKNYGLRGFGSGQIDLDRDGAIPGRVDRFKPEQFWKRVLLTPEWRQSNGEEKREEEMITESDTHAR